jgi:hypothetical protein
VEVQRQVVEQAASFTLRIVPAIVDEDETQSSPPRVEQFAGYLMLSANIELTAMESFHAISFVIVDTLEIAPMITAKTANVPAKGGIVLPCRRVFVQGVRALSRLNSSWRSSLR